MSEIIITPPVRGRTDRTGNKSTTAVRTDVMKYCIYAVTTKSAFVTTNTSVRGFRRQGYIAVLTSWSEIKHDGIGRDDGFCNLAERSSSGTGGAAESMNEAGEIQITMGFDTTTSAPPVVQQRHCSAFVSLQRTSFCAFSHDHD